MGRWMKNCLSAQKHLAKQVFWGRPCGPYFNLKGKLCTLIIYIKHFRLIENQIIGTKLPRILQHDLNKQFQH